MPLCPKCSAEVVSSERKCPSCGAELNLTSDPTSIQNPDHTPTKIKSTEAGKIHTTSSGSGARFVAGHVLAGRYRIIGLIGRGGMGEVYKAEDLELEQTVALKFLPAELSKEEDLLKRFRSEVRTARQVSHPNVCRVFDIGETEGLYYITMEFIEGDDLSMLLQRIGRLPSDKAVEISRQICLGLGAIHKAGILHRDLKPSNIIIDQKGEARITDFGIAGIEAEVQGEESRVGTPAYMSPEQITGKEVTQRSDIYSLGLLLYEIFTGKQAFEGKSVEELIRKHQTTNPTTPSEIVTGIDPIVERVIEACISKDPTERPASALKVAMSLPGGDPLQVALEAGETPTPEMVAAAPQKGVLSKPVGLGFLVGFVVLTLAWTYFAAWTLKPVLEPVRKSPEVLSARAQEIAAELGYRERPGDSSYGYDRDFRLIEYADSQEDRRAFWERFRTGTLSPLRFDYRQSPEPLVPLDEDDSISEKDPPMTLPGMIRMELDVEGRLRKFIAVPPPPSDSLADIRLNWANVFEVAGLQIDAFEPAEPHFYTIYNHEEMRAWKGALPGNPDIPVTIEASSFRGRLVTFEVFGPWSEAPGSLKPSEIRGATNYVVVFFSLLTIFIFIGAALLARYNLRKQRGDLMGALKVALFVLLFRTITTYVNTEKIGVLAHDTARINELLESTVFLCVFVFIVYLAIEPIIRKSFPKSLVSWNRILAGNVRDPLVGRDILIGLFTGSATVVAAGLIGYSISMLVNGSYTPGPMLAGKTLAPLENLTVVISGLMFSIWDAVFACFIFFLIYLAAYLIFRNKWVALIAFLLFFLIPTFLEGIESDFVNSIVGNLAFFIVLIFCLLRFGFVAAASFMIAGPAFSVLTYEPGKFFFPSTLLILGFYFAAGLAAFTIATYRQPWLKRDLLD